MAETKFSEVFIEGSGALIFRDSATQIRSTSSGVLLIDAPTVNLKATITPVDLTTSGNTTLGDTLTDTTLVNGKLTATVGVQSSAVAVAATETGATTGIIPAGTSFASVTSGNIAHIVKLPTPVAGNVLYIKETGTTGFEIMPAANTQFINGTECTGTKSLAMAGNTGVAVFICVAGGAAGKWVQYWIDDDGTVDAGGTPD